MRSIARLSEFLTQKVSDRDEINSVVWSSKACSTTPSSPLPDRVSLIEFLGIFVLPSRTKTRF